MQDEQSLRPTQSKSGISTGLVLTAIFPIYMIMIAALVFSGQSQSLDNESLGSDGLELGFLDSPVARSVADSSGEEATFTKIAVADDEKADPPVTAPSHFATCVACHGKDGIGMKTAAFEAPRLAGLPVWYVKKQMMKFRNGQRGAHADDKMGAQMVPFAKMLADEAAVDAVATEIATFKVATPPDAGTGDAVRGAASLMLCKTCHGQKMEGMETMAAPPLSQQHAWYLASSIHGFKSGIRGGPKDDALAQGMRGMSMTLANDASIQDAIAAIQALNEAQQKKDETKK